MGIALAMLYLQYEKPFSKLDDNKKHKIHLGLFLSMVVGFIGAFVFDAYTQGIPITLSNLNLIGLTLLGGVAAGLLTLTLFLKCNSLPILTTLNMITPAFCLSHILGRAGCFFAGCCFGSPTRLPFGVKFPKDSLAYFHFHKEVYVHPTQLYESVFILLLFFIIRRNSVKNKFLIYISSYSVFRFSIEFIRADNRGIILNQSWLTPSQFISLIIALTAIVFLSRRASQNLITKRITERTQRNSGE